MVRYARIVVALSLGLSLGLPVSVSAATLVRARTLVVSEAPPDNLYLTGTDVTVTVPLPADVLALGGTLTLAAPVAGDAFLVGGSIGSARGVLGDLRALGGSIDISGPVGGDLILAGGSVSASTTARDTLIAAGTVRITGSGGSVTAYGSDITLSGTFLGNVDVVASDRLTLLEGTRIQGTLRYNAPQEATVPAGAVIDGGITYTGAASYLPTAEQARTFAIAGASVLFIVKILAALIAAGLLAGLFPLLSRRIADRALLRTPGKFALLALLGFAIVVATPVLTLILLLSFVGAGVAIVLGLAYLLLLILGYLYAGILAGAALSRGLMRREGVTWKFALLGMLALCLIGVIPVIGDLVVSVLFLVSVGALVSTAYQSAFTTKDEDPLDLELL